MYTAHYDNKQGCTRRAATFMMYLTDVDAGGATHFPKAVPLTVRERSAAVNAAGIRIWPKRGRALVFWSVTGGVEDPRSLHEAEPIVEGEKWIATKWLQVKDPSVSSSSSSIQTNDIAAVGAAAGAGAGGETRHEVVI